MAKNIFRTRAAINFRKANEVLQAAGCRVYYKENRDGPFTRLVGPEEEIRALSLAAFSYPRQEVLRCGPNKLGSYTLELRVNRFVC